jgi:hypothetical protein
MVRRVACRDRGGHDATTALSWITGYSRSGDEPPAMFRLLGTALLQPVPSRHEPPAVVTDMPDIIDMSYASPDAWHALPPPIRLHEKPPLPALEPNEVDFPSSRTKLAVLD